MKGRTDSGPGTGGDVFTVANADEWASAVATINSGGPGKTYTINVTASFSMDGITGRTFTPTGVSVTISGDETITLTGTGSLLSIGDTQTVIMEDLDLAGNDSNDTSLVSVNGTFTMKGSASVSGNTASNIGGGVSVLNGGVFTMEDNASVLNNTSSGGGGGVAVGSYGESSSTFIMKGSARVSNNTASSGGGVLVLAGRLVMEGNASVSNNTAHLGEGGGVSIGAYGVGAGGTFTMEGDAEVKGNTATGVGKQGQGGGVAVLINGRFNIASGAVYGSDAAVDLRNTADVNGAALYILDSSGTAQYGTYSGDTWTDDVWTSAGDLTTTNNTIRVVNGALQ